MPADAAAMLERVQAALVVFGGMMGLGLCVGRLLQWWSQARAERRRNQWGRVR